MCALGFFAEQGLRSEKVLSCDIVISQRRGTEEGFAPVRGALLFGNFFLGKQEKVTCRGSATHKYGYYIDKLLTRPISTSTGTHQQIGLITTAAPTTAPAPPPI